MDEYQGWRRRFGNLTGDWMKVEGAVGRTKAEAYNRLMELSELAAGPNEWSYQIAPVGVTPSCVSWAKR